MSRALACRLYSRLAGEPFVARQHFVRYATEPHGGRPVCCWLKAHNIGRFRMKGMLGRLAVFGIATCLSACVTAPPKHMDWRENPASSSNPAVLRCWPSLQILSIDGNKKDLAVADGLWFQRCEIQIDPGAHLLVVRHYSRGGGRIAITSSTDEFPVQFVAEPGGLSANPHRC
jgi:hypothetical protein